MSSGNIETNKIFAAVLTAALVAMITGFIAKKLVHPHDLEEDAVFIEGGPVEVAASDAPQLPDPILDFIATADVAKGQRISKACAACHSFEQGGADKVGPNLYNIVNRDIASHGGFAYSDVLTGKEGSWTYDNLNAFLWKPKVFAPGTKMNYLGLKKPEDRAAMIAWLRTLSGSPAALPSDADIAAEKMRLAPPEPEMEEGVSEEGEESSDSVAAEDEPGTEEETDSVVQTESETENTDKH